MRNNVFIDGYSYSVKADFSYDKIPLSGCYRKGYFIIGFSPVECESFASTISPGVVLHMFDWQPV